MTDPNSAQLDDLLRDMIETLQEAQSEKAKENFMRVHDILIRNMNFTGAAMRRSVDLIRTQLSPE